MYSILDFSNCGRMHLCVSIWKHQRVYSVSMDAEIESAHIMISPPQKSILEWGGGGFKERQQYLKGVSILEQISEKNSIIEYS